jgi:N-acetylglucosamine-6-phosphate deacetylase
LKIIDIHTHGICGLDTKTESPQEILKIAELQGFYGISEILLTIYPNKIKEMRKSIEAIKKAMDIQKNSKKMKHSAKILGVHLEGPFLNLEKAGSLNPSHFIKPERKKLQELIEGYEDIIKIITIAPELEGAIDLIKILTKKGIIVSLGHSNATYNEAYSAYKAGAKGITHLFNAMRGIHHREPGIAGFGLTNQDIYVEIIADPYHINKTILDLIFKTKNRERIIIISDSISATKYKNKNVNEPINKDGILSGGSMVLTESISRLISLGYNKEMILSCVTKNPKKYLKI